MNISNNKPSFYPYSIEIKTSKGSCSNIVDPYGKFRVPDIAKNINSKYLIYFQEQTKKDIYNGMKLANKYEDQMQVFLVINNDVRTINADGKPENLQRLVYVTKHFFWICECESDKSCDIGEYLDYKNCK